MWPEPIDGDLRPRKERCNWSAVFRKAIETDCVGWGPELAIQPMESPFLVKTKMPGMGIPSLAIRRE
jgi:hypothetical protein